MTSQQLAKLQKKLKMPDAPGVYTFRDSKKRPLYIGRATSLKNRVRSYFKDDLIETRGPRLVDMITKAAGLTWETTDSVLEAIILESNLIKKYQPFYNVDERDDKSAMYVVITEEKWPRVFLARARDFDQARKDKTLDFDIREFFGPFPEVGLIKEALKILRKLFPFRDKKAGDPRHEAFYRSLGWSPDDGRGSDVDAANAAYLKTIEHLILFFKGRKRELRAAIKMEMKARSAEMRFEDADRSKRLLFALDHINDMALLKNDRRNGHGNFRLEAYDVGHLGGSDAVGTMVVSETGQLNQSQYRKFKLRVDANNDIAGLTETLFRRLNHTEWDFPDIIIVDGNETQVKHAENVLKARRIAIPVVGVTKDDRHKAARLIGHPDLIKKYKQDIIALNAEAHRFTIAYHRKRRGMRLL